MPCPPSGRRYIGIVQERNGRLRVLAALLLALLLGAADPARHAWAMDAPAVAEIAVAADRQGDPVLTAVYAERGFLPLWTGDGRPAASRKVLAALLASDPWAAPLPLLPTAQADAATFDVATTRAALDYLARRGGGGPLEATVAIKTMHRLETATPGEPLAVALLGLHLAQDVGGWRRVTTLPGPLPTVPPVAVTSPELDVAPALPRRTTLPEPASLRRRMVQSGDLPVGGLASLAGPDTDPALAAAVRAFQERNGLLPDGVVGPRTLAAMNAPVSDQIATVRLNLARGTPDRSLLARYVEVDVPGSSLRVVDHGRTILRSRAIVGDRDNATPIFDDLIRYIEINPSWYVPTSIVPELLEKETGKPGYLASNGFEWRGGGSTLVQKPGPTNALGRIKFLFPNHHAVYLHDTPQRSLFVRSQRSLSHGCVRVEKPDELAMALLGEQGWNLQRLQLAYASPRTQRVELAQPVPVFLDYRTAFLDDQGRLNLRPDLYGYDRAGLTIFDGSVPPPHPYLAADTTLPAAATRSSVPMPALRPAT